MASPTQFPTNSLRAIRAIATLAFALSAYLLIRKLTGDIDSLAGCGGEGGCSQVLGGRWSMWFGIPVTVFAALTYAVVFVVSLPSLAKPRPHTSSLVLRAAAVLAVGAALWFFAILILVEKTFCPYCSAVHLCGLAFGGIVFFVASRALPHAGATPFAAGLVGVAILAAGQIAGPRPDTHEIAEMGSGDPSPTNTDANELQFVGGRIRIMADEVPSIGPEEPEHYIVELFDYTCASCRKMYGDLKALQKAHPDKFTVLYLPCPLNRKCNLFLRSGIKDHPDACELARTALTVWRAEPEKFAAIHEYLMTTSLPLLVADAEAKAISLVGEEAYRKAQRSPAIDGLLAETFGHYGMLSTENSRMPQLLLGGNSVLRGTTVDSETFVSLIAKHFQLGEVAK
jgi:uncharacterized membrane protein